MIAAPVERVAEFTLYDVQDDFVADTSRYPAFIGGRGSGKTYAGSVKAALRCLNPGLGVIAAPDFPMLEQGAKRQFLERLEEMQLSYTENKQKGMLFIPRTGAEVLFATLETESRVRSPNFSWGWVDELEYLVERKIWLALKGAVRAGDFPQLWATTTPKGRKRIVYPEWVAQQDQWHTLHRATSLDNPFHDAEGYVAALGYEGAFYRQEIEASFEAFEGVVYPMFSRETHVKSLACADWQAIIGVDAGTRNPTAIVTIRHSGDARHQERELYQRGLGSDALKAAVRTEADRLGDLLYTIEIDPSAAGLITDLAREGYPVRKANNSVTDGIREVSTALASGMTIDPTCTNTIDEYEAYQYPEGGKSETDKPLKVNDHAMDASRYALLGLAAPRPEVYIL